MSCQMSEMQWALLVWRLGTISSAVVFFGQKGRDVERTMPETGHEEWIIGFRNYTRQVPFTFLSLSLLHQFAHQHIA